MQLAEARSIPKATYAVIDRKGIVRVVGLQPHNLEKVITKLLDETPGQGSSKS